jgi:ADP-ribosylglycohydrolase
MMINSEIHDRIKGALMGAFIGDVMGAGAHWYYDLDEMRRDYGEWIDDYVTPKPGRYHDTLDKGELSQAGYILKLMVRSLIDNAGYDQTRFCALLDTDLLPYLDGKPMSGPGGYTNQSIREIYRQRIEQQLSWDEVGSRADTTESIERTLAIAIRYAFEPGNLARAIAKNTHLTQVDDIIGSMSVAYGAVLAQLIQGEPLDTHISMKLMKLVKEGELPFHAVTSDSLKPPAKGSDDPSNVGLFASPDALLSPSYMASAVEDETISIEPAWKASLVYGMPCAIYHILPASYYLASRFRDDFESGLLHAINGGGQNLARAMLTATLIGAQVGFSNIPQRFVDGLAEKEALSALCDTLAESTIDAKHAKNIS